MVMAIDNDYDHDGNDDGDDDNDEDDQDDDDDDDEAHTPRHLVIQYVAWQMPATAGTSKRMNAHPGSSMPSLVFVVFSCSWSVVCCSFGLEFGTC